MPGETFSVSAESCPSSARPACRRGSGTRTAAGRCAPGSPTHGHGRRASADCARPTRTVGLFWRRASVLVPWSRVRPLGFGRDDVVTEYSNVFHFRFNRVADVQPFWWVKPHAHTLGRPRGHDVAGFDRHPGG